MEWAKLFQNSYNSVKFLNVSWYCKRFLQKKNDLKILGGLAKLREKKSGLEFTVSWGLRMKWLQSVRTFGRMFYYVLTKRKKVMPLSI